MHSYQTPTKRRSPQKKIFCQTAVLPQSTTRLIFVLFNISNSSNHRHRRYDRRQQSIRSRRIRPGTKHSAVVKVSRRRPAACKGLLALRHRTPSTVRDRCLQKSTSTPTPHAVNCTRQLPTEVYQHSDTARRQLYKTAACRSLPALRHRTPSTVRDGCLQKSTSAPTSHAVNCTISSRRSGVKS